MTSVHDNRESLLQAFISDERFWPCEPQSAEETGLPPSLLEALVCKYLLVSGTTSGRVVAEKTGIPFRITEEIFNVLRTRQSVVHSGSAPFNDYYYALTEEGQNRAKAFQKANAYVGSAPVSLQDYIVAMEAQGIRAESPSDEDLARAFNDISVSEEMFDHIGPAVNSGAGMFLYGSPGNGKSTIANRIPRCFGQDIWIPQAVMDDGQIIKLYDATVHELAEEGREDGAGATILESRKHDRRWVRIRRPAVRVGGELTMEDLEIRFDPVSRVGEAPLQMKANGGSFLIDDFGRQRIEPAELLNRWIVPLEGGYDFLRLSTGKKIQVPFELMVIFSTNLEPRDLVDEAFLRRIPYKIEITDPSEEEFIRLFEIGSAELGCPHNPEMVRYLLDTHYRSKNRPLRRCHARDILKHVQSYCRYRRLPFELRPEHLDRIVHVHFTSLSGDE